MTTTRTITITLVGSQQNTDAWASYLIDEVIYHLDNDKLEGDYEVAYGLDIETVTTAGSPSEVNL